MTKTRVHAEAKCRRPKKLFISAQCTALTRRSTRARRYAKVKRHQSSTSCSDLCGSRLPPEGEHELQFLLQLRLRQLPLCVVLFLANSKWFAKTCQVLLRLGVGCWPTSIAISKHRGPCHASSGGWPSIRSLDSCRLPERSRPTALTLAWCRWSVGTLGLNHARTD